MGIDGRTLQFLNVLMLYKMPESKMGNGVGVFNAYFKAKEIDGINTFVGYLINWVAGAKLIFIMIGIVVVIFGDYYTQLYTVIALILSILSFYWRLFPTIKKLDQQVLELDEEVKGLKEKIIQLFKDLFKILTPKSFQSKGGEKDIKSEISKIQETMDKSKGGEDKSKGGENEAGPSSRKTDNGQGR